MQSVEQFLLSDNWKQFDHLIDFVTFFMLFCLHCERYCLRAILVLLGDMPMSLNETETSADSSRPISVMINSISYEVSDIRPDTTLLQFLRLHRGLCGTKEGCAEGDCGACTVVLGRERGGQIFYQPVNACITLLPMVDKAVIRTVEGVAREDGTLHPVQQALVDHHGSQCGFCTPGFVMSLFAGWLNGHSFAGAELDDLLSGNLCRCTGYGPIVRAAESLAHHSFRPWEYERISNEKRFIENCKNLPALSYEVGGCFYTAPDSIDGVSMAYFTQPDAQIVAGATDIGVWINKQNKKISKFISIQDVSDLSKVTESDDGFFIGASTTHQEAAKRLSLSFANMGELWRRFGSVQVRSNGTVGGNIANGSPIGDLAPALIALNTKLHLRCGEKKRQVDLENFFIAYGKQDRQVAEWVEGLFVPRLSDGWHFNCHKLSRRFDQDISSVMGAFALQIGDGVIQEARVVFGGMAAIPKRATSLENELIGQPLRPRKIDEDWIDNALQTDFTPLSDVRASNTYRLLAARNLLQKCRLELATGVTIRLAENEPLH